MRNQPEPSGVVLYIMYKGELNADSKKYEGTFSDRYDGIDYEFEAGKTLQVPFEAAHHIFGYGEEDKTRAFRRQGVMATNQEKNKGQQWLARFEFEEMEPPPAPDLSKRPASRAASKLERQLEVG